jgi:predicted nucleic acid-binding protein
MIWKMPDKKWVFDTVVLSNFLLSDSSDLLIKRYGGCAIIPWEVYDEIAAGCILRPVLRVIDVLIDKNNCELVTLTRKERRIYSGLLVTMGKGEAAAVSIAQNRKGVVCTDDKVARKECGRTGTLFTGTIGILQALCVSNQIRPDQADAILLNMIGQGFYSPVHTISGLL